MRVAVHENQLKVLDRSCLVTDSPRRLDERRESPFKLFRSIVIFRCIFKRQIT